MRRIYSVVLLVFVFGFSEILCASTKDKEHIKKKTLLKLRTDINANETVHSADSLNSNGTESESVAADKESTVLNGDIFISASSKDADSLSVNGEETTSSFDENENTGLNSIDTTTFKAKMRTLLKRVLDIFGWSAASAKKRKDRFLESSTVNSIRNFRYKDEMRATMGAMLGEKECYKRAVCKAGRYLKDVKGKEMIIVILEKVVPENWTETVGMLKEAAIYRDQCHYKCLDD